MFCRVVFRLLLFAVVFVNSVGMSLGAGGWIRPSCVRCSFCGSVGEFASRLCLGLALQGAQMLSILGYFAAC